MTARTASKTLEQLRSELNDQLLIRRDAQMVLSRRAEHLVGSLGTALDALDSLLKDDDARSRRTSAAIAMRNDLALALAPGIVERLAAESPHTAVKIVPLVRDQLVHDLAQRTIDVAVATNPPADPDLIASILYRDRFVCVTSDATPLTLERYVRAKHVTTMSHDGRATVDAALARNGYKRKIVAQVPHLAALLQAAKEGLCATLPCRAVLALPLANLFIHSIPAPVPK